jgi:prefoldin subunit 5
MTFNYKIKITYTNGNVMENLGTEFAVKNSYDLAVKFAAERNIATVERFFRRNLLETYAA